MSDVSLTRGRQILDRPVTVNAVFQLVLIAMLAGGGVVGKSAYDDLADRLTDARIEAASLRVAVEGLSSQRDANVAAVASVQSQVQGLDLRLTALEVKAAQEKRK